MPVPLAGATGPDQRRGMDFVSDRLADGRWFRILIVVDRYTRECLCMYTDRSQAGRESGRIDEAFGFGSRKPGIGYYREPQRVCR